MYAGLIAISMHIVACQAHPALGKLGKLILARIFHFNGWFNGLYTLS